MLGDRVRAYRACFRAAPPAPVPWWAPWRRGRVSPPGEIVLRDLARICFATKTTASKDAVAMGVAEGRRQVLLHVQRMLSLTDAEVHRLTDPQELDL